MWFVVVAPAVAVSSATVRFNLTAHYLLPAAEVPNCVATAPKPEN